MMARSSPPTAKPKRSFRRRLHRAMACALVPGIGLAAVASIDAGCTQQPVTVPLRSLERSGRVSYVCLAAPGDPNGVLRPLSSCTGDVVPDPTTFVLDDAGVFPIPHLYALVTQTTRGEVAVVDITAQ